MAKSRDKEYTARVVFYGLDMASGKDVTRTVEWLRETANFIKKNAPKNFGSRYIARLMK